MEIKQTLVLDTSDFLSKALPQLEYSPAVIVTRNGKYHGIIDHRCLTAGIRDPANTKCETVAVRPPVLSPGAGLVQRMEAFMLGHFKALPVIDEGLAPVGITTRVELLRDMIENKLIPPVRISELMNSPVYTISENETIAAAKSLMKEKRVRRLVVMKNSAISGVVSAFDIGAWEAKPNLSSGRKDIHSAPINVGEMKISGFLRPDIALIEERASLQEAVEKMIDREVSAVIVIAEKKPVGVLSAMDVFKSITAMGQEELPIQISGLPADDISYHPQIKAKLGHVLERFASTFNIRNVSVHIKEGKSTYVVNIYLDTDDGHVSLKGERASLKENIDELAVELNEVLRKKKELRKPKQRTTHMKGRGKT